MLILLAAVPLLVAKTFCNGRDCCPNYQVLMESGDGCLANSHGEECYFKSDPRCPTADYFKQPAVPGADAARGPAVMMEGMDAWIDMPGSQIHNIPPHMQYSPALFLGAHMPPIAFVIECDPSITCDMYISFYECGDCANLDGDFPALAAIDGWTKVPCQMRFTTGTTSNRHRLVTYVKNIPSAPPTLVIVPNIMKLGFFTFSIGEPCHTHDAVACAAAVPPMGCKWDASTQQCSIGYCPAPRGPYLGEKCSDHACALDEVSI